MSKKKAMPPELVEALNATHDIANDMGDGAWWTMLEDTVNEFNRQNQHGYDPNDTVHRWIRESPLFVQVSP